jgi:hypothetical protein
MVRVLRRLKIDHVASVDRGAGDGCHVVLFKRDDTPDNGNGNGNDDDEAFHAALAFLDTPHGAALLARFFPRGVSSVDDIERLGRLLARRMRAAARANSDAEPSDPYQPWTDVIGDADEIEDADDDETEDEDEEIEDDPMRDRNTELEALAKRDGGVHGLARRICKQGGGGISEHELTELITRHAMQLYPDMSPEAAFTKVYCAPGAEPLRLAVSVVKGMLAVEPIQVDGDDVDVNDAERAYEKLQKLADAQRRRVPSLSRAQAFERAGRDRPDLLNRAT